MSYLNATVAPVDRAKAAISVIGIHALLGAGVVLGLAVTNAVIEKDGTFIGTVIEVEPPPPPEPIEYPPEATAPTTPPVAPLPPVDLAPQPPITVIEASDEIASVTPTVSRPIAPLVRIPPVATITPTGPIPANPMNRWVTNDDYSRTDLIRGREGTARYRLVVGSDGRVDACEIVASTGHSTLDRTTCRMIERRARFDPATNNRGEAVVGTYTGAVTWQIPD